jgi:hypothetical protein
MGNDAIERIAGTLSMSGLLIPDELDLESPMIKTLLDSLNETRRKSFLMMFKDADNRKLAKAFSSMMGNFMQKIVRAKDEGKKIVLTPFTFAPQILNAMDLVPLCGDLLSGMALSLEEGVEPYLDLSVEKGLPESMCSAQKVPIGLLEADKLGIPDLIINSALGSCDPNTKAYEYIAERFDVPALYLDIPYYDDDRSMDYYVKGFKTVIKALEEFCGKKLDFDRLSEICELSNKATELLLDIHELKRNVPNPVSNSFASHFVSIKLTNIGSVEAVDYLQTALEIFKDRLKNNRHVNPYEKIRCIFMWTNYFFDPTLLSWLQEEAGVTYLHDLLTMYDFNPIIETTSPESMIRGLAKEMFNLPMIRQLHVGMDKPGSWVNDLIYYAGNYKADCMVFSGNLACKHTWGAFRLASDAVSREIGIPSLCLEGDSWDSRITPASVIKDKLEEFFETIS